MKPFGKRLGLKSKPKRQRISFVDIPPELRTAIYNYVFQDCFVRYYVTCSLSKHGIIRGPRCEGPEQHQLLATCKQIYREALPILQEAVYVVFDDRCDTETAFYDINSSLMSPFLRNLILATKKLIISSPAEEFCKAIPNTCPSRSLSVFSNLETVEIFGFYPKLMKWLNRGRAVAPGYQWWHWKIFGWESAPRPTTSRKVDLTMAADWVHTATGRDVDVMTVFVDAWAYEPVHRQPDHVEFYVSASNSLLTRKSLIPFTQHMRIDADDKKILLRERLQIRSSSDYGRWHLETESKKYRRFRKFTEKRREAWLEQGDKVKSK
jgi:hypothetical protein